MQIKTGIDIMSRKRFHESLIKGAESFQKRVFLPQEQKQNTPEQLASIFSLKEAVMKALELPVGSWLTISTNRKPNGKISLSFLDKKLSRQIQTLDTSVSHDGEWVIAVAVICLKS